MTEAARDSLQASQLKIYTGMELGHLETRIQEAIARRAYDVFERRGRGHGGDLSDWFGAEDEIERPSNVTITEKDAEIDVRVEAPGFAASEIELGVSGQRVVIWGLRAEPKDSSKSDRKVPGGEFGAFLADVRLPSPVQPNKSIASFKDGWIEIRLTKES
jgi:HSP20 family molecular chaperone IbpA